MRLAQSPWRPATSRPRRWPPAAARPGMQPAHEHEIFTKLARRVSKLRSRDVQNQVWSVTSDWCRLWCVRSLNRDATCRFQVPQRCTLVCGRANASYIPITAEGGLQRRKTWEPHRLLRFAVEAPAMLNSTLYTPHLGEREGDLVIAGGQRRGAVQRQQPARRVAQLESRLAQLPESLPVVRRRL